MSKKFTLDLTTGKGVESDLTTDEQKILDDESKAYADAAPARALERLREKRNILLTETDHYALADQTLSDDMKTYRQNLRDLPTGKDTVKKCEDATWPSKPD